MIIFNLAIKRLLTNKTRLLILLVMPLLFIAMFAMQDERSITIGIVDEDQSFVSTQLISNLENLYKIKVKLVEGKSVYDKTVSYQIDYALYIEEGFQRQIINGENPGIKEFYLFEREKLFYVKNFVETYVYNIKVLANSANYNEKQFINALEEYEKGVLEVVNEAASAGKIPQTRQAMGFLVQFMIYMSVITAGLILEDKNSGVFHRIFYAPVTLSSYIYQNLLAFWAVGALQVTTIMLLLKGAFGMDFDGNLGNVYVLFLVFSFVCITLGMWLITLFKKPIGAYATIILITTPLVMLGGCYWPMEFMPETIQKVALFVPTTWVMGGVDSILYDGKSVIGIYLEIVVLLIFSGIFLSAGLFKKVDVSK